MSLSRISDLSGVDLGLCHFLTWNLVRIIFMFLSLSFPIWKMKTQAFLRATLLGFPVSDFSFIPELTGPVLPSFS